ncbi:MAG: VCBS repeat-containing protein [Planctomycetales bacterium]|nr:VCBS repeat-containing protein [Planctomycetales bacterium]
MYSKTKLSALLALATLVAPLGSTGCRKNSTGKLPDSSTTSKASGPVELSQLSNNKTDWSKVDDPSEDGLESEEIHEKLSAQLNAIGDAITNGKSLETLSKRLCASDLTSESLLPSKLNTVVDRPPLTVRRAKIGQNLRQQFQGNSGFQSAVGELQRFWQQFTHPRFKSKVVRVTQNDSGTIESKQYVAISGRNDGGSVEQNAIWSATWGRNDAGQLQIQSLHVDSFEQSELVGNGFSDVTQATLQSNNVRITEQFGRGMNHWIVRNHDLRYFSPLGNPGLAVGDVNSDGLEDLFICQESQLPNRLLIQQADGTAVDQSAQWNVDWLDGSRSALLIDLDNDGDQDLVVAVLGGLVVAENVGTKFNVRDVLETDDDTMSLAAADFDNDGDVDIYVCVGYPNDYFSADTQAVSAAAANRVYHDAGDAGRNTLFRNDVEQSVWKFTDVTEQIGLNVSNDRFSFAASWEDFDNDGDQDLYVANDFGPNNLYRNDGDNFTDVAAIANAEDRASGMSVSWGDYNRDGNPDVYVANMFSSAGSRITHQPEFKSSNENVRNRIQRFARGSTLLANSTDHVFHDVSESASVTLGRWAWSSNFIDFNNDGWDDLLVANGYITANDTGDL